MSGLLAEVIKQMEQDLEEACGMKHENNEEKKGSKKLLKPIKKGPKGKNVKDGELVTKVKVDEACSKENNEEKKKTKNFKDFIEQKKEEAADKKDDKKGDDKKDSSDDDKEDSKEEKKDDKMSMKEKMAALRAKKKGGKKENNEMKESAVSATVWDYAGEVPSADYAPIEDSEMSVPSYISSKAKEFVKETEKRAECCKTLNPDMYYYHVKCMEAVEQINKFLQEKTVDGFKRAQLHYGRLMSPIQDVIPNEIVKFLMTGTEPSRGLSDILQEIR